MSDRVPDLHQSEKVTAARPPSKGSAARAASVCIFMMPLPLSVRRCRSCSRSAGAINFLLDLYSAFDLTVLPSLSPSLLSPPKPSMSIASLTLTKSMLLSPPERLFCAHFNFASLSPSKRRRRHHRHPNPIEGAISDCRRVDESVDGPDWTEFVSE